jgi:signal transduction histidine kinase
VSHELKTPLTAIRLYAEMLRDGLVAGDEKRREYYGSISAETERLSRLIDNVLEFSRLEKGARSLELRIGEVAPVVREAVELLRPHAAAHGLALELLVDGALPPVRFERDALLQVVFNLIDNSVKYGRGEPATIEIACRRAGEGVAIVVRDHGPGVPREEIARILEPFYRRGDELTRSAPGAGIGLALVESLAREMGGVLRVANADGGGLAVTLELSGSEGARAV